MTGGEEREIIDEVKESDGWLTKLMCVDNLASHEQN